LSKRKSFETACFLCLFLFAGFRYVLRGSAASNPSSAFLINPSSLTVSVNTNFTVVVSLTNAQYLDAWQVILKYNGTGLRLTKLWVPSDNVFAGHTIEVTPSRFNYTDAIDGSNSCMIGACVMGSDYVNVSNGAVLSANFAVLSAGQWSIEVADKSNPLHKSVPATSSNLGPVV